MVLLLLLLMSPFAAQPHRGGEGGNEDGLFCMSRRLGAPDVGKAMAGLCSGVGRSRLRRFFSYGVDSWADCVTDFFFFNYHPLT